MKNGTPRGEFIIIQMSLYHLLPPKLTERETHSTTLLEYLLHQKENKSPFNYWVHISTFHS